MLTRHSEHMHRKTLISALIGLVVLGGSALPGTGAVAAASTAGATTTTASARATMTTVEFENRLLSLTNARRAKIGCGALRANTALIKAARLHTKRMVTARSLSHRLPGEPGLASRIVNAGYLNWTGAAENIAWGAATPQGVFTMWMRSSGHRANIQRCAYRDAGIGVVVVNGTPWVTLDLGRRR